MEKRPFLAIGLVSIALAAGCGGSSYTEISGGGLSGVSPSSVREAIFGLTSAGLDTNGDGEPESTTSDLLVLASDQADLCSRFEGGDFNEALDGYRDVTIVGVSAHVVSGVGTDPFVPGSEIAHTPPDSRVSIFLFGNRGGTTSADAGGYAAITIDSYATGEEIRLAFEGALEVDLTVPQSPQPIDVPLSGSIAAVHCEHLTSYLTPDPPQ